MNEVTIKITKCMQCKHCNAHAAKIDEGIDICYHPESQRGGRFPLVLDHDEIPDWCPLLKQ